MAATTNKRATVFNAVKMAVETTPGTAPSSGYKRLTALGMTPTINATINAFKPAGQKYTTVTVLNREDSVWAMDGAPTYTEIVYPLSSVLTEAQITAPGGTTSAAAGGRTMGVDGNHWFFAPSAADADAPVSFTTYKGGITGAERATFTRFTGMSLTMNRTNMTLTGSALARALEAEQSMPGNEVQQIAVNATGGTYTLTYATQTTGSIAYNATPAVLLAALEALSTIPSGSLKITQTVNASPAFTYTVEFGGPLGETNIATLTALDTLSGGSADVTITTLSAGAAVAVVELVPINPDDICIWAFDTAQASIATTNETDTYKLTDVLEVTWMVDARFGPYYTLDCEQSSYSALIETPPTMQLVVKMLADSVGMGYLEQLRNGGTVFFRIKAIGSIIDTVEEYEFTIDFAGKISAASELADSEGVYAITWTFDGVPELVNGGPVEMAAVNDVTGL